MSKQVQIRRGSATDHATFTGRPGEVTYNTDRDTLHAHDGVTPGGQPLQRHLIADVKAFGAVGDGTTDDTTAIQAAVTYAIANEGRVWFPAGTYYITTALSINAPNGLVVEGTGGKTTILTAASCGAFSIGDGTTEQRHILLRDLKIRTLALNSNPAILAQVLVRSAFRHVIVSAQEDGAVNFFNTAIDLRGVDYVDINNCNLRATTYGIQARSKSDGTVGTGLFLTGGTKVAEVTAGTAVRIHGGMGGVIFADCDLLSCTNGVTIENSIGFANREFFLGSTCTIDTCTGTGLSVGNGTATHVLVTGTWFGTCGTALVWDEASAIFQCTGARVANPASGGYGFRFTRAGGNVSVVGCRFAGAGGALTAIEANVAMSTISLTGNVIQTWTTGIVLGASISAYQVGENVITGCTTALTTSTAPDGLAKAVRNNVGHQMANSGQVVMTTGASSVTVSHGMVGTPQTVLVTPSGDLATNMRVWVDTLTSTEFTIRISGTAPAPGITWFWRAQAYTGE